MLNNRPRFGLLVSITIVSIVVILRISSVPQRAQEQGKVGSLPAKFASPDAVTADIRNGAFEMIRVNVNNEAERAMAAQLGRVVADYGSFVVIAAQKGTSLENLGLRGQALESYISLAGATFDPIADRPEGTIERGASPGDGYYIVQFGTTASDELIDSIKAAGVEVIQYVPNQAYFVYGSGGAVAKVAEHSRVRWVGSLRPEYKLSPILRSQLDAARSGIPLDRHISPILKIGKNTAIFDVMVFERASLTDVADQIRNSYGGKILKSIDLSSNYFNVIRVELPLDQVEALSNIPDVVAIDSWIKPQKEDEIAAHIVAGNYVGNTVSPPGYDPLTQFGTNGNNVTVAVSDDGVGIPGDGGFYVTAANAVNGPLRGATAGAQGHGHLQASIIAGTTPFSNLDANGYNYGLGVAPASNIINIPFLRSGYSGAEADMINDSFVTSGPNGIPGSIVNNSWGAGTNGNTYDALAAQFDGLVRDSTIAGGIDPITIVFSAGNSGGSGLTRPKVAKNVISVAASENIRPTLNSAGGSTGAADNLEQLPDFSSRGPAADTRIKPDITAPGDAVTGGRSGPDALFGNVDTFHRTSSGTSHAAPQVAGAAALFTQWWKDNNAGANPSPAMIKAALINGAVEMTGAGATAARPNGAEGWGRINLKNVLNTGAAITYINQTDALTTTGSARIYNGTVPNAALPVRVSLVWTDPPGVSDPSLVNNLDLEVTVGGNTYRGNVFSGGSSTTGGTADIRNNVENVFLPAGVSGPITVRVFGTAINGDGVLGNGDTTDQHFALVVFNGTVTPDASPNLVAGTATIVSESCLPANGVVDPGETVTLAFPVQNVGLTGTANDVGTMQASGGVIAPSGPQNYGVVASGGSAVTRNFTFTADPGLTCGSDITATVQHQDGAANLGNLVYTIPTGASGTPIATSYSGPAVVIPDNNAGGVNVPLVVTGVGTVGDLDFRFDVGGACDTAIGNANCAVYHSYIGDLVFKLTSPLGTTVTFIDRIGAPASQFGNSGNNFGLATIDDDGGFSAIENFTGAPVAGNFSPNNALSAFDGENANGTWVLNVSDQASSDTGSVRRFSLLISPKICSSCNGATPTPTPTPTATPTATPTSTPTATPTPGSGFESDVSTRPNGDGVVLSGDVIQMRRFSTGLDTPSTNPNEFQRADSAPRETFGDGLVNSGDVIQARRYATGLDPASPAAGPTAPPPTTCTMDTDCPAGSVCENGVCVPNLLSIWNLQFIDIYAYFLGREMRVTPQTSEDRGSVTVAVEITPYGDEVAAGFTLEYDAAKLSNPRIELAEGAPQSSVLTVNTNEAGRIGILVDSTDAFIASAVPKRFLMVTFDVAPGSTGETPISLTDRLAAKAISDANGNTLAVRYLNGSVNVTDVDRSSKR